MNADKNKVQESNPVPGPVSKGGSKPYLDLGVTLSLGAGVGIVFGILLNNLALWMMVGAGVGVAIGAALESSQPRRTRPPGDAPRK